MRLKFLYLSRIIALLLACVYFLLFDMLFSANSNLVQVSSKPENYNLVSSNNDCFSKNMNICTNQPVFFDALPVNRDALPVNSFDIAFNGVSFNKSKLNTLKIITNNGEVSFVIDLADNDNLRRKGLMFREDIPDNYGMLFNFGKSRIISMWMKNTPSSLDMLFIDKNGIVKHIVTYATPYSLDVISSVFSVKSVLEIKAGQVEKLNIQVGDKILHRIFDL